VIEVGVDVPNACCMVIEDAERFGLAQLHQLRGRVGRGEHQSFCVLLADPKTPEGVQRLEVMTRTTDGFVIAEEDLGLRGPGEFLGTKQSGLLRLRIANIIGDRELLEEARAEAFRVVESDPGLQRPEHRLLSETLRRSFADLLLATVG
jgi:ATP-dependent DNA helicase RecG